MKSVKGKRYRSAVTGKFVTPAYAKRYPHKVVGEMVRPDKSHKKNVVCIDPRGGAWYD